MGDNRNEQVFGKQAVQKPNVYIASSYTDKDRESSLDVAEAVSKSPFVNKIFVLEGLYDLGALKEFPPNQKKSLSIMATREQELADIFIIDRRYGDPVEWGYAFNREVPIVIFDPNSNPPNPVVSGHEDIYVSTLNELGDLNYLKMLDK